MTTFPRVATPPVWQSDMAAALSGIMRQILSDAARVAKQQTLHLHMLFALGWINGAEEKNESILCKKVRSTFWAWWPWLLLLLLVVLANAQKMHFGVLGKVYSFGCHALLVLLIAAVSALGGEK
jgi:hypothetical protein